MSALPIRAWLGLTQTNPPLARICARCPDAAAANRLAAERLLRTTHTLCLPCACDTWNEEFATSPPTRVEIDRIAAALASAGSGAVAVHSPDSLRPYLHVLPAIK